MNATIRSIRTASHSSRGFSLLELMLVLAIIGVLMAVAAVNIMGGGAKAKRKATQATMATIKGQLQAYHLDTSSFPPTLATLVTTKYLENKPIKDGWDNDFYYSPTGPSKDQPFVLKSPGENKQLGDEDDIDIWSTTTQQ